MNITTNQDRILNGLWIIDETIRLIIENPILIKESDLKTARLNASRPLFIINCSASKNYNAVHRPAHHSAQMGLSSSYAYLRGEPYILRSIMACARESIPARRYARGNASCTASRICHAEGTAAPSLAAIVGRCERVSLEVLGIILYRTLWCVCDWCAP